MHVYVCVVHVCDVHAYECTLSQPERPLFSFRSFKAASEALGTPWSGSCSMETRTSIVTSASFCERENFGCPVELLDLVGMEEMLGLVFVLPVGLID